jgi:hypothetical protein
LKGITVNSSTFNFFGTTLIAFPEGMLYDKKNDRVRTYRVNTLFSEIAVQAKVLGETKNDNPFLDCHFGSNVGMITGSSNYLADLNAILISKISLTTKNE